jgi:flavin reductase (DIM6/NTAB) family NADH-FMN oxidoreductase RutF
MKVQLGPTNHLFPMPALLVAVRTGEGTANLLAVAWAGVVGGKPPLISIHLGRNHFSTPHIRREKNFTVNVPSSRLHVAVDYCGIVSGRKDPDKAGTCGLTLAPSSKISSPIIVECPLNLECELEQELDMGGGILFIARVVETHADEEALDEKRRLITEKLDPLVFLPNEEYRRLGDSVATPFKVGKQLKKKG